MMLRLLAFALVVLSTPVSAATLLSADVSVDDRFSIFLSTDDAVPGTLFGMGDTWSTTYSFSQALTPGVTNYLHVQATDLGILGSFAGDFILSDAAFAFANGTQTLLTSTLLWGVNLTGFGNAYSVPRDLGPALRVGIDPAARSIWDPSGCTGCTAYFSATIFAIPEPQTYALLLAGLVLIGFRKWGRTPFTTE